MEQRDWNQYEGDLVGGRISRKLAVIWLMSGQRAEPSENRLRLRLD